MISLFPSAEQQQQLGELSALMGEEEIDMMPRRVQPTPTGPGSTARTGPLGAFVGLLTYFCCYLLHCYRYDI